MLKTQRFFYLALFVHLLIILSYSLTLKYNSEFIYKPTIEASTPVSAYVYHEPIRNRTQSKPAPTKKFPPLKKVPVSILGYEAPAKNTNETFDINYSRPMAPSPQRLEMKSDEKIDAPLLQLLSEATSSKLFYPQASIAFRQTGRVKVRFYIFPDGRVTRVSLVGSSGFSLLDDAALQAIKAISPVRNTSLYLKKPQYITAYIDFRER